MSDPLREFAEYVEQACERAKALLRKHDYVFRRFPRDMKAQPPVGDAERWEAMAFSLYSDLGELTSKAIHALNEADEAALSASGADVDPSQDLATAFAEKFPQQDLPADAAKVFRENSSALLNEEPPAGVDDPSIIQEMRTLQAQVAEWLEHGEIGRLLTLADDLSTRLETWIGQLAGVDRQAPQPLASFIAKWRERAKSARTSHDPRDLASAKVWEWCAMELSTISAGVGVAPTPAEKPL